MLEQARAAESAGFEALASSDHFAPWWPEGKASFAWTTLAAIGQQTTKPIGTSVTPVVHHYHPGVIAQAFMGLEAIRRLWDGETVTMDAGWFALREAKLYTRARSKPKLYVSAFGPQAAEIAAKHGDGLWTLGDPEQGPEIAEAYRSAGGKGEIIYQAGFSLGTDEQQAIDGARMWKATQLPTVYKEEIADEEISGEEFAKEGFLVGADPEDQISRIREMEGAGATVVCLQCIGADPLGSIERYGEHVLPALRGTRV